jgi:hypothetical protein
VDRVQDLLHLEKQLTQGTVVPSVIVLVQRTFIINVDKEKTHDAMYDIELTRKIMLEIQK